MEDVALVAIPLCVLLIVNRVLYYLPKNRLGRSVIKSIYAGMWERDNSTYDPQNHFCMKSNPEYTIRTYSYPVVNVEGTSFSYMGPSLMFFRIMKAVKTIPGGKENPVDKAIREIEGVDETEIKKARRELRSWTKR